MLDIKFIRENPDQIKKACAVKGFPDYTDKILALDARVRELKTITQAKTAEKNKISRKIAGAKNRAILVAKSKKIVGEIAAEMAELAEKENALRDLLLRVPQIPDVKSPVGADEKANVTIKHWGKIKKFNFTPRAQWELLDMNHWWAPDKITQICGSRTYCLIGEAAELQLAIETYAIQKLIDKGFVFIECPSIVKPRAIFDAGHFAGSDISAANNDVFILQGTGRCLSGTSEIVLNCLHSGEILSEKDLPIKYAGFSPCFRKEAGAAGRDTRGLARFHQFNKVEQFVFCRPQDSDKMHEFLLNNLCEIMQDLELPYRVVANSTGDMGFNKIKMNDVEAWIPSENGYKEMGSCSSVGEFQSRRTNTRYRDSKTGEVKFCATLNNTGIALPRALIPILENHQNKDGSVNIPKKLRPFMNGRTKIGGRH